MRLYILVVSVFAIAGWLTVYATASAQERREMTSYLRILRKRGDPR